MLKIPRSLSSNSTFTNATVNLQLYKKPSFDQLIDKTLLKIEVMTMSLAFAFALIGNLMVLITLMFRRYVRKRLTSRRPNKGSGPVQRQISNGTRVVVLKPRKPIMRKKITRMNFFILNLSFADVYVSIGNILTMLLWRMNNNLFYAGDLACRAVAYFQLVSVYYSTYVLIAMTIDRYQVICKPLSSLGLMMIYSI